MGPDGTESSYPGSSVVAKAEGEAARFENTPGPETIGRECSHRLNLKPLQMKLEGGETPIKQD
jgi:hypothetical protein